MANIKFISGDGVEHEVEETSPAADHMRTSGFQRIYSEAEAAAQLAAEAGEKVLDLSKLKKAELIIEAEKLGVEVTPAMTVKQILAAIEAK